MDLGGDMVDDSRPDALNVQSDIAQIIQDARHRWLRPDEIYGLLLNSQSLFISPKPPTRPPSGSVFLFDRKRLPHFRNDGHNWRKDNLGRNKKESQQALKVGGHYVLRCYYAHGQENEDFQRRSYWIVEKELSDIVLVHYLEVQGDRTNLNGLGNPGVPGSWQIEHVSFPDMSRAGASSFPSHNYPGASGVTDASTLNRIRASEHQHAEPADMHQPNSLFHAPAPQTMGVGSFPYHTGPTSSSHQEQFSSIPDRSSGSITGQNNKNPTDSGEGFQLQQNHVFPIQNNFETSPIGCRYTDFEITFEDFEMTLSSPQSSEMSIMLGQDNKLMDQYVTELSEQCQGGGDYSRVSEMCQVVSSNDWTCKDVEMADANIPLGTSLHVNRLSGSKHERYSIVDISPNWAYSKIETKIIIKGTFLSIEEACKCKWSCIFGAIKVPAEVVADGVLQCYTPEHKEGRVTFCVEGENNLYSDMPKFEFLPIPNGGCISDETQLRINLGKLLSLESSIPQTSIQSSSSEVLQLRMKISVMLKNSAEWEQMLDQNLIVKKLFKEMLYNWLIRTIHEGVEGLRVLDERGQGVLHIVAALGYDWAIKPITVAGVDINFRDANGWTAFHWAAYNGRYHMVPLLISLDANPEIKTNPTPKYRYGRTAGEIASINGHDTFVHTLNEEFFLDLNPLTGLVQI